MKTQTIIIIILTILIVVECAVFAYEQQTVAIHFYKGWNYITIPSGVKNESINDFFPADVRGDVVDMWKSVNSTDDYAYYSSNNSSPNWKYGVPITTVNEGEGYYVNASQAFSVPVR